MEDFLKWRDSWLTGIEALDVQHAELAAHLNSIAKICFCEEEQGSENRSGNADSFENMVARLYDMTKQHFQYEEQLMLDAGYPDYSTHVHEHSMLLAELKLMIRTRLKGGCDKFDRETLNALKSWFIAHIAHNDKLFAQFMSRHRAASAGSGDSK